MHPITLERIIDFVFMGNDLMVGGREAARRCKDRRRDS